jgi:hypothetical protein
VIAFRLLPTSLIAAGVAALGVGLTVYVRRRRKTPEQLEQERRLQISSMGRIIDGTVTDVAELAPSSGGKNGNGHGRVQLLIYHYDVSGVTYEASQDVTHLRHRVDLHTCRIGLPTSVKYDPQNPANSIVVAEEWSGLRN